MDCRNIKSACLVMFPPLHFCSQSGRPQDAKVKLVMSKRNSKKPLDHGSSRGAFRDGWECTSITYLAAHHSSHSYHSNSMQTMLNLMLSISITFYVNLRLSTFSYRGATSVTSRKRLKVHIQSWAQFTSSALFSHSTNRYIPVCLS